MTETKRITVVGEKIDVYLYMNQGKWWFPNGKPRVLVSEMDESWRGNAARWLVRQAKSLSFRYDIAQIQYIYGREVEALTAAGTPSGQFVSLGPRGDMACDAMERDLDREQEYRANDPERWVRSTPLYLALTEGDSHMPDQTREES